ncbi:uncharacterized protein LOC117640664 [Thrips palmi]|uniref:Uncharacterized protein LOC117640664 n=1 Tax=Thrips palmi TaxID=161013 RepID=A0A6P8Y1G6_THRPL|nr:uncharacterized protein LOC117640664 [Thrips palmi]
MYVPPPHRRRRLLPLPVNRGPGGPGGPLGARQPLVLLTNRPCLPRRPSVSHGKRRGWGFPRKDKKGRRKNKRGRASETPKRQPEPESDRPPAMHAQANAGAALPPVETVETPQAQVVAPLADEPAPPPPAAFAPLPESCDAGGPEPVGAGGRVPSNLKAVDIGVAVTAPASAAVQPSTSTPLPRSSPAEAAEATWPPSAPAGRPVKKGVRRCGVEGAAGAACSSTGLLSTALSTAAALPTASAAESVFHFEATAESNAAVATASTADAAAPAAPNPKKRAATDDAEVVDSTTSPIASPIASPGGVLVLPDAKRARCDVIDLDLDKVVHLLVGSGARLIYRTRARELVEQADWTVLPRVPKHATTNPLQYVPLDRVHHHEEFHRVERDFDYSCRGQGFQVTRVCRVENDWLLYEFQERVWQLEQQCGDVAVLRVYHGTPRANVHSIAMGNLDRRYAGRGTNHAWWGKGVNFSPISYYASHYGDQGTFRSMMVFDVVVGRACSVLSPPEAPLLPKHNPGRPGQRYDTNLKLDPGPQVVCKFGDHQFYPAYIIDYTAPPKGHRWHGQYWEQEQEYCPWWLFQNFDLFNRNWMGSFPC